MLLSPDQLIIPDEKILDYLLVKKQKNDKAGFLEKLGFTKSNYKDLIEEIKRIAISNEAILTRTSDFGNLYRVKGKLKEWLIVTIWLEQIENNKFRFVTLYPATDYYEQI